MIIIRLSFYLKIKIRCISPLLNGPIFPELKIDFRDKHENSLKTSSTYNISFAREVLG